MALLALLHWSGASTCRLSRRETLLPCSVGVVQALGIRFCAVGKEAWQKADDDERMNVVKRKEVVRRCELVRLV